MQNFKPCVWAAGQHVPGTTFMWICMGVCVLPRGHITSGMILTLYDWLNNNAAAF